MKTDDSSGPDCMQEKTKLVSGPCPLCGKELEFFSLDELRNQRHCYNCKKPLDVKEFAKKAGVQI